MQRMFFCVVSTFSTLWINPGMVANPTRRRQLKTRITIVSLSSFVLTPENLVSRDGLGLPFLRQLAHSPLSG